jgi:hypothetical protein
LVPIEFRVGRRARSGGTSTDVPEHRSARSLFELAKVLVSFIELARFVGPVEMVIGSRRRRRR